jgi:hypothetical protein
MCPATYVKEYREITFENAFFCPICRKCVIATSPNELEKAERFIMEHMREVYERNARHEAERIAREERRVREVAEMEKIAELNRDYRQKVILAVRLREEKKMMILRFIARDEPIPDDFEFPPPSPSLSGFWCKGNCSIPMRDVNYFLDYNSRSQEIVTPQTKCVHCKQYIAITWDLQESEVIRVEERRRVDTMLIDAHVDRERRRVTLPRLEERDIQVAPTSEMDTHS